MAVSRRQLQWLLDGLALEQHMRAPGGVGANRHLKRVSFFSVFFVLLLTTTRALPVHNARIMVLLEDEDYRDLKFGADKSEQLVSKEMALLYRFLRERKNPGCRPEKL